MQRDTQVIAVRGREFIAVDQAPEDGCDGCVASRTGSTPSLCRELPRCSGADVGYIIFKEVE